MRLLHKVKRSMSDSDFVALGLALPKSLVTVRWLSLTFGSETVPATCRSAVLEDLLLLCLVSEIERFTFCSCWLASLLVTWFTCWYSEALPMRIIPIKVFKAVRLNKKDKTMSSLASQPSPPSPNSRLLLHCHSVLGKHSRALKHNSLFPPTWCLVLLTQDINCIICLYGSCYSHLIRGHLPGTP